MGGRSGQKISPPNPPSGYDFTKIEVDALTSGLTIDEVENYMKLSGLPYSFQGVVDVFSEYGDITLVSKDEELDSKGELIQGIRMVRVFHPNKTIYNSSIRITNNTNKEPKYSGLDVFSNQVKEAKKQGYKEITTTAAGDNYSISNGYYTWLRLGYKPDSNFDALERYKTNAGSYSVGVKKITDLMKTEQGRKNWKYFGEGFQGTFDLSDNSYSMNTLNEYRKEKGLKTIK